MTTSPINEIESDRLRELEKTIGKGQKTFVEVGLALAEIRDSRLYRRSHKTFQDYCRVRWGWEKAYAHRIIECSATASALPEKLSTIVDNPGKATALSRVPKDRREEVLTTAAESAKADGKDVTALDITKAAAGLGFGPKKRKEEPPPLEPDPPQPSDGEAALAVLAKRLAVVVEEWQQTFLNFPDEVKREQRNWVKAN